MVKKKVETFRLDEQVRRRATVIKRESNVFRPEFMKEYCLKDIFEIKKRSDITRVEKYESRGYVISKE